MLTTVPMNATMVTRDEPCPECRRLRTTLGAETWEALGRWYRQLGTDIVAPQTLDRALAALKTLVPADRISVLVPVADSKLQILSCSNQRHIGDLLISLGLYPELRFVLDNQRPLFIQDVLSAKLLQPVAQLIGRTQIRSIAAVPLILSGVQAVLRMSSTSTRFGPHDLQTIEGAAHLLGHLATDAEPRETGAASSHRLLIAVSDMAVDVFGDGTIVRVWGYPEPILGVGAAHAVGKQLTSLGLFAADECAGVTQRIASAARHAAAPQVQHFECNGLSVWVTYAGTLIPFYRLTVRRERPNALSQRHEALTATEVARQRQLQKNLARVIRELEDAQKTIARLQVQRTEFVASAAHELKTPLTVAQSYLEILTNDLTEGMSSEQISFVKIAYENVLRLRRLVIDLVDLAAIEGGELSLSIGRVEISPIIENLAAELTPIADRGGVSLSTECLSGLPAVRGDGGRIAQILRNLLDNALKYTPAPGSVVIRTRQEGDAIVIDVEDTGIGIPESLMNRVFDPFFRAPKPSGFFRDGSGLGLTISRRVVGALGGKLTAINRPEGGSVFRLALPRWPESYAHHDT